MKKHQLLNRLDEAWGSLKDSYAGLTEAQMLEPGVTGQWSVRDILAHVTIWEEEALKYLPYALEGRRPPRYKDLYGGIDAFNAQMIEKRRGVSLAEVTRQFEETHNRLVAYIESVPEVEFASETRFRRRIRLDTYSHYPIHAQAIRDWRGR